MSPRVPGVLARPTVDYKIQPIPLKASRIHPVAVPAEEMLPLAQNAGRHNPALQVGGNPGQERRTFAAILTPQLQKLLVFLQLRR